MDNVWRDSYCEKYKNLTENLVKMLIIITITCITENKLNNTYDYSVVIFFLIKVGNRLIVCDKKWA